MANTITESKLYRFTAGDRSLALLVGTMVNTDGSTGGVLSPGNNTTNVTGSSGIRKILQSNFECQTASPDRPQVVKSYDTTYDGDILTVTTTADYSYDWWLLGEYV